MVLIPTYVDCEQTTRPAAGRVSKITPLRNGISPQAVAHLVLECLAVAGMNKCHALLDPNVRPLVEDDVLDEVLRDAKDEDDRLAVAHVVEGVDVVEERVRLCLYAK